MVAVNQKKKWWLIGKDTGRWGREKKKKASTRGTQALLNRVAKFGQVIGGPPV